MFACRDIDFLISCLEIFPLAMMFAWVLRHSVEISDTFPPHHNALANNLAKLENYLQNYDTLSSTSHHGDRGLPNCIAMFFLFLSVNLVDDSKLGCCSVKQSFCRIIRRFDSHHNAFAGDLEDSGFAPR